MNNNKKNIDNRHLLNFVLILSGGSVAILGILVILGWHIQNVKLIQVFPNFVPMQYNTAIGFLLCGIGLILRVYNLLRLSVICGATVVTLGLLTLVQYIFNLNIGIDQLFVNHYITVETSHPGRMAPNTALCFVLSGTYLLITNLLFNQKYQSIITIFISTTISAFGIVAFFGYLFGIEPAYGWSYFTSMAVHTALGFIILSSGLIVYTWKSNLLGKQARFQWVPVFIGIGFMIVTLLIWQALEQQEQEYISRSNELRAKSLKNKTEEILESRILALKRMAQRWEIGGRTPKEEWESDATNHVNNHPVYQAIEWVDTSFHVRWIVPLKGNEEAQNLNLAFEEHRRIALEQARDLRKVTATSSIDLVQGGKGFLVYVPLYLKEGFDGFILGVFRIQKLFDLVLSTSNLHGYSLTVFDGEDEVYRKNVQKNPNMHKWGFVTDIKCCEVSFRVLTWPSPELLAQTQSFVPEVTLGFGLFFSFLFSLTIYFYQTSRLRTKQVELSNQGMHKEIITRKQIEEEIKQLNESLEQRVVKRTEELAKSNEQLNKLYNAVQQSHNAVMITNFEGNIEYVNPSFTQLTGYTLEEAIGENPRILKSGKTPPEEYKRLWENITSGKEWQREICNKKKNGELYWETVLISPVKNAEGVITHFIKIAENITERKRAEEQLINYQLQLKRLASMLSLTEERERRHISEDLHDRIGQTLAFIKMKLEELRESGVTTNVDSALRKIQDHLDTTIRDTRSLIAEISPLVLYELGFELAVKRLIEEFREKHDIVFNFVNDKQYKPMDDDMGFILFKSVRELLFNVTKHAKAHRVKVSILREGDNIRIDVEDDGVGFDYAKDYFLENKDSGFGLFSIRERLEYMGGCLEVRSKPDHGTRITLVTPLKCKEEVKDAK